VEFGAKRKYSSILFIEKELLGEYEYDVQRKNKYFN
jgi:hypothetical protein